MFLLKLAGVEMQKHLSIKKMTKSPFSISTEGACMYVSGRLGGAHLGIQPRIGGGGIIAALFAVLADETHEVGCALLKGFDEGGEFGDAAQLDRLGTLAIAQAESDGTVIVGGEGAGEHHIGRNRPLFFGRRAVLSVVRHDGEQGLGVGHLADLGTGSLALRAAEGEDEFAAFEASEFHGLADDFAAGEGGGLGAGGDDVQGLGRGHGEVPQ